MLFADNFVNKKGVEREVVAWLIALLLLVFLVLLATLFKKQLFAILDEIKTFLRFGR